MKVAKNKYQKLATTALSLATIFVVAEGNKWNDAILYTLVVTVTMYSYAIAIGLAISISAFATWSVINSYKIVTKIRRDNLELVKSMIATVDSYNNHKAERLAETIK